MALEDPSGSKGLWANRGIQGHQEPMVLKDRRGIPASWGLKDLSEFKGRAELQGPKEPWEPAVRRETKAPKVLKAFKGTWDPSETSAQSVRRAIEVHRARKAVSGPMELWDQLASKASKAIRVPKVPRVFRDPKAFRDLKAVKAVRGPEVRKAIKALQARLGPSAR